MGKMQHSSTATSSVARAFGIPAFSKPVGHLHRLGAFTVWNRSTSHVGGGSVGGGAGGGIGGGEGFPIGVGGGIGGGEGFPIGGVGGGGVVVGGGIEGGLGGGADGKTKILTQHLSTPVPSHTSGESGMGKMQHSSTATSSVARAFGIPAFLKPVGHLHRLGAFTVWNRSTSHVGGGGGVGGGGVGGGIGGGLGGGADGEGDARLTQHLSTPVPSHTPGCTFGMQHSSTCSWNFAGSSLEIPTISKSVGHVHRLGAFTVWNRSTSHVGGVGGIGGGGIGGG